MFLQLVGNDPKFPKGVRRRFETLEPGKHCWVIVKASPAEKDFSEPNFEYVSAPGELASIVAQRDDWEGVIVSGMLARVFPYLDCFPRGCSIAYNVWGGEAYGAILPSARALYEQKTSKIAVSSIDRMRYWLSGKFGPIKKRRQKTLAVAKKVDVAVFAVREEPQFFAKQGLLRPDVETLSVRGHLAEQQISSENIKGENLLVGNSGDPSNNHMDCLKVLQTTHGLGNGKIIVPLSYGGSLSYRDAVAYYGKELFGERFLVLNNFLALEEYRQLIGSCQYVFMNHKRQQAAGNVVIALARGATVYLRKDTTLSRGLKRLGFVFQDFEQLEASKSVEHIDANARQRNRQLYLSEYGEQKLIQSGRKFLERVRYHSGRLRADKLGM